MTLNKPKIFQDIDTINASLGEKANQLNAVEINVMYPPAPLVGCKCDANYYDSDLKKWYSDSAKTILATDDSTALQNLINNAVTSTWLKIPKNICLNSKVSLSQGIHLIGESSFGYGAGFNETMIVTNMDVLDGFFYFNSDGITNSWHHATLSYLHLKGDNKVGIGIDLPSPGECSEIHHVICTGFTNAGIRLYKELAPGTIRNVSLMDNNYGLLVEDGRHTLNIDGISGDSNLNLIRFKNCQVSLGVQISGVKSENITTPIVFENCNGGTFVFVGGSYYPAVDSVNCINILSYNSNRQIIIMLGLNCSGYTNILKDDSSGGRTIVNNNGQNGVISYNAQSKNIGASDSGFTTSGGIYLNTWDYSSYGKVLESTSGAETRIYSLSGTGGLVLIDNSGNKHLRVGKLASGVSLTEFLRGIVKPIVTKTSAYDLTGVENTILCDASIAAFTISNQYTTMPVGFELVLKKIDSSVNAVTFSANGKLIDGATSIQLTTQWQKVKLVYDGTQWLTV